MKWLAVSLAVVLLFAGLFGLIIGFAPKKDLPSADDDNALMNQSSKPTYELRWDNAKGPGRRIEDRTMSPLRPPSRTPLA